MYSDSVMLKDIEKVFTPEENRKLSTPFTLEEKTESVKMRANNKGPGSDGITPEFYKEMWDIIGEDVTKVINTVIERGRLSVSQNTGLIVLIPKVNKQKKIEDYRPLTLLNCDLKILTRAVTARLTRELSQPEVADLDKHYRFWSAYPVIIYGVFKIGGISF